MVRLGDMRGLRQDCVKGIYEQLLELIAGDGIYADYAGIRELVSCIRQVVELERDLMA